MEFEEKTVKVNYIHKGKIINVRSDDVVLPDGKSAIREIVEHGGGAAVLCVKDGKILLVKQYRYAYKDEVWEIPAGKLNAGEPPEQTAVRELEEECGVKAGTIKKLFEVYPTPGYTNEIIRIYQAYDLTETETNLDEDEFLTSFWVEEERVKRMIKDGEIKDGKTLIALLYFFAKNKTVK